MTDKVYVLQKRNAIEEEAGQWLIKLDGDTPLTQDDIVALREWLERGSVHQEELSVLLKFYNKMNILTELTVPLEKPKRKILFLSHQALGAIAGILIFSLLVVFIPWLREDPLIVSNGLYATAVGQQKTVTLVDSSVIQLNTNSQIEVEYNRHYRNVRLLQGEAYFNVAKNTVHPFRVYAGTGRVEAIGTAFSIYLKNNDINVTVTDGRVRLAALDSSDALQPETIGAENDLAIPEERYKEPLGVLEAGQSTTIRILIKKEDNIVQNEVESIETIDETELARRLAWREGLLIFTGDPLQQVVDEISRYSPVTIEIVDPEIREIRIGGQFRVGDIDAMINALETNFHLRIIRLRYNHIQIAAAED